MKRKTAAFALCGLMVFALAGCGGENGPDTGAAKTSEDVEYDVNDYVTLGDYQNLEVQITGDYTVDQSDVDAMVDNLIASAAPCVEDPSQTVVAADSLVNVDYVGKKDGEAFDGGSASDVTIDVATNSDVSSGSGYIEGFSAGLVGAHVGDTVDCNVTFPENYSAKDLAGQPVVFTFAVNYIGKPVTRDTLTDDYVSEYFQTDTVDEFLDTVEAYVNQTAQYSRQNEINTAVMEAVVDNATVEDVPQELLDLRVQEYTDQFEAAYCSDGTSLEDYLDTNYGMTVEEFTEQITETMRENLITQLVFEAVADKEGIELDEEGFDDYCDSMMEGNGFNSREDLYAAYGPTEDAGKSYLQKIYVCSRACEFCAGSAVVTEAPAQ
ncbi:MAG: trigger factor [Oscillospiraceae bacterium]